MAPRSNGVAGLIRIFESRCGCMPTVTRTIHGGPSHEDLFLSLRLQAEKRCVVFSFKDISTDRRWTSADRERFRDDVSSAIVSQANHGIQITSIEAAEKTAWKIKGVLFTRTDPYKDREQWPVTVTGIYHATKRSGSLTYNW